MKRVVGIMVIKNKIRNSCIFNRFYFVFGKKERVWEWQIIDLKKIGFHIVKKHQIYRCEGICIFYSSNNLKLADSWYEHVLELLIIKPSGKSNNQ